MNSRLPGVATLVLLGLAGCQAERPPEEPEAPDPTPTVVLETTRGTIVMELDREKAPVTVENFLWHVQGGFYDGLIFHRVISDFMIQTGQVTAQLGQRRSTVSPILNEAANGLSNQRGTVAMARTRDPNSAMAQFFINVDDNPNLDFLDSTLDGFGYAVFGKVIEGMDVADSIGRAPTAPRGQYQDLPVEPAVIRRAYVQTEEREGS